MKRISTLLLAAAMTFGAMGAAQATEIKAKGIYQFAFGWVQNSGFKANDRGVREDDNFISKQRVRTQINFITSESLQGVLMFEIGKTNWGRNKGNGVGSGSGGQLDSDGVNVKTKLAYLDWIVPSTDLAIRMGIQTVALPSATGFGNPVFNDDVAGITASYKFDDMFSLTGFWLRPFDQYRNDNDSGVSKSLDDETDAFGFIFGINGDGWSVTPWAMYAQVGNASGLYQYLTSGSDTTLGGTTTQGNTEAWWAGTAFELTIFDPLTFSMDFAYGDMHRGEVTDNAYIGTRGWFVDAALNYKLDWGTPGIFGWYSSGDSEAGLNGDRHGRLPVVGLDSGFGPTSFGLAGTAGIAEDSIVSTTGLGTWGIGIQIADMSFVEDLSHTLRFAYYRGTNDHEIIKNGGMGKLDLSGEAIYLTDKDHAFEINFDHTYQIYENLAAIVELGYINLDLDSNTWKDEHKTDDAWKAQVMFHYTF